MSDEFLSHKFTSKVSTRYAIALTTYRDSLCIAWVGTTGDLNLAHSYDGGQSFDPSSTFTIQETSYSRPSLAIYHDQLYIAWTDVVGNICLMRSTDGGRTFDPSTKSTSDESTFAIVGKLAVNILLQERTRYDGPSLAVYQDRLYVAWADASHHPCLMFSTDGGQTFNPATKSISKEVCFHANLQNESYHPGPTLAIYRDQLSIVWIGTDGHLHMMHSTDGGRSLNSETNFKLKEKSYESPAFINYQGRPLLAWCGVGMWNRINVLYAPSGELKDGAPLIKLTSKEKTGRSPALALSGNRLVIGWTAGLMSYLNLAQCQIPPV